MFGFTGAHRAHKLGIGDFAACWDLIGKNEKEIESFVALWKTLEETLMLIQQDNTIVKDLEQQLAAAEQGIELE